MNNYTNYGYSSPSTFSSYSSPYSSTPTGIRVPPRPRFAYSGPTSYPRPRSSASKPNPDSFNDSMANNYGGSANRMDGLLDSRDNFSNDSSSYFSSNDTFLQRNKRNEDNYEPEISMEYPTYQDNDANVEPKNEDYQEPKQFQNRFQGGSAGDFLPQRGANFEPVGTFHQTSGLLAHPTAKPQKFPYFQNTQSFQKQYKQRNFAVRFGKARKNMEIKKQWRCDVCSIDFTSQIPLDMHLRGARHARKMKTKEILNSAPVKAPVTGNDPVPQAKELFCELCNVQTNSSLQLQTHLDGNKHKNKLKGDAPKEEAGKTEGADAQPKTQFNGNGSLTRTLPSDFGEPQPAKLTKFTCEICNVFMNSNTQLSQHLASKKHQAKVEGKPLQKGKKAKEAANDLPKEDGNATTEPMDTSAKDPSTVMGLQALSSSFVQSGTLL